MPLHVALLEAVPAPAAGRVARRCADVDASLHLIGPLDFPLDDALFLRKGPEDWSSLDWWVHPEWRDFRNAISRERCLYFAAEGRDLAEAPFRPNSVLIFGDESLALPDKIRDKYPDRIFQIPTEARGEKHRLQAGVAGVLAVAAERLQGGAPATGTGDAAGKKGEKRDSAVRSKPKSRRRTGKE